VTTCELFIHGLESITSYCNQYVVLFGCGINLIGHRLNLNTLTMFLQASNVNIVSVFSSVLHGACKEEDL